MNRGDRYGCDKQYRKAQYDGTKEKNLFHLYSVGSRAFGIGRACGIPDDNAFGVLQRTGAAAPRTGA